ncbi:glycoside hydrolase family 3 protein [Streptomyces sp. OR43]|uniref:glycoside hydrolase family 3 protein n=1 Tax=Streptomyces sp. or43 TaxID=2478957 RepID=UPI0011CE66D3|nr:glycoside hydrolase family 3 protein [Streptomyces sp. or43]TXS39098.1 glycoside hydrolase [Streptomyces sp. or43]
MNFTRSPRGARRGRGIALASATAVVATVVFTGVPAATAATSDPNPAALELKNAALSREAATQGMVLLENHDHALPISRKGNVALFGVGAYKTVKGGTGSGNVNNRYTISARQGLTDAGYKVTTSDAYWSAMTQAYDTKYPSTSGSMFGPSVDYASVEQPLTAGSVAPAAPTDTAVFVVARNSGEGADRSSGPGDYELTSTERANLKLLGQTYKRVVVVLNTGGVVDTSFFPQINDEVKGAPGGRALDALLLMSQAGQESGSALVEVLNGTVTPSGKLTDTWASAYSHYPASSTFAGNDGDSLREQYSEGIYVGYRYFDSFYRKIDPADPAGVVNYPFGYGQSYTSFDIEAQQVKADARTVKVTAKVTNTGGGYSGKEVVQVYVSAPQNGLDKAYQQLTGYAKTDSLAPGQSQTVTISFDTTSLAAYDESRAAYVMDAGDYVVRVGNSSRNTHVAARLNLSKTVVTEQDHTELDDQAPDTELTSSAKDFYTYRGEQAETARAHRIRLDPRWFRTEQRASPYQQDTAVDSSSPYHALDGDTISSTTVYLDPKQKDWEGTGAAYRPKTGEKVKNVPTSTSTTLYDVAKGKASIEQFVAGLNVSQLADIVEGSSAAGSTLTAKGAAGYTTPNYEKLGIPGMALADGPAGLRLTQKIDAAEPTYQWGTAWPIGTLLAQSWDRGLVSQVGEAVGEEMAEYGVQLWLAPGMNIHRDPLNGRNFEYYSEDPLIAGLTAAATTEGVQSIPGVGVTIKHFAANAQETSRNTSNSVVGERALREIELKGFEIAVKAAQPMSVMSSYNKINGTWAASNYDLLTDVLRGEWGYKGTVMSDWGGSHGALTSMYAGNDLIEPGGNPAEIINAIKQVAPAIDVSGLPVYNRTTRSNGRVSYNWQFGGLTPSATGGTVVNTTVDRNTDLSRVPRSGETVTDAINNQVFTPNAKFTSVDDAYRAVAALLAPDSTALSAAQKAAISITGVQHATAGDVNSPVVAYTVALKGDYPAQGYPLRLGDLQRSAIRVLTTASQSSSFEELAGLNGVKGIKVGPYTSQFKNLEPAVTATLGKVSKASGGHHGSGHDHRDEKPHSGH